MRRVGRGLGIGWRPCFSFSFCNNIFVGGRFTKRPGQDDNITGMQSKAAEILLPQLGR